MEIELKKIVDNLRTATTTRSSVELGLNFRAEQTREIEKRQSARDARSTTLWLSRTSVPEAMFAAVSLLFVLCSTSSIAHFLPFLTGALQLRYLSLFSLFCSGCPNTS